MPEIAERIRDGLERFMPDTTLSIKLGIIGAIAIVALFFIAFAISAGSKISKYRRKLIASTKKLHEGPAVTEERVGELHADLETHPEGVRQGWAAFLDNRRGFPSDYINSKNPLGNHSLSGKCAAGKMFLGIAGAVACLAIGMLGILANVADGVDGAMNAVIALQCVITPAATYVIATLVLDSCYGRAQNRMGMAFESFCEELDAKVVTNDREEPEFRSENLEEINRQVDELMSSRMTGDGAAEVISVPKIDDIEELTEEEEESWAKEVAEAEAEAEDKGGEATEEELDAAADEALEDEIAEAEKEAEPEPEAKEEPAPEPEEEAKEESAPEPEEEAKEEPTPEAKEEPAPEPEEEAKEESEEAPEETSEAKEATGETPVKLSSMSESERANYFVLILDAVDRAIADDALTPKDYANIAEAIHGKAKETGAIDNEADMEIFEECYRRLAERTREIAKREAEKTTG